MEAHFKRPFSQYVKKARKPLQLAIKDEVDLVCALPEIGKLKIADLAGIRVHKFQFNRQNYLMAYRLSEQDPSNLFLMIDFYQVGSHENFYDDLKRYLKHERHLGANPWL